MRESISIVRRLCAEANVVGFDLVELHPVLDPTYRTTLNSVHIIKACATGIAMRKEGITEAHYLSPVASEHAIGDYYGDQQKFLDKTAQEDAKEDAKEDEEDPKAEDAQKEQEQ
jgi:agmatinase